MENTEINPKDIIQPQNSVEKIASFFRRGVVTNELISRLSELEPAVTLPGGDKREITMKNVDYWIARQARFVANHYPSGFRYNAGVEALRKETSIMNKAFKDDDYKTLIGLMLKHAIKEWDIADRQDERVNKMSPEERAQAEKLYIETLETELWISKEEKETGIKQEHGIPPELAEVGGARFRRKSRAFLSYAIVLAKAVTAKQKP